MTDHDELLARAAATLSSIYDPDLYGLIEDLADLAAEATKWRLLAETLSAADPGLTADEFQAKYLTPHPCIAQPGSRVCVCGERDDSPIHGVPGGGEPQPTTSTDNDPLDALLNAKVRIWFCPENSKHRVEWDDEGATCLDCGRKSTPVWATRPVYPGGGEPQPTTSTDNDPVWCVKHRDGWCATKDNHEPEEGGWSVPTRCGYGVTLPGGYDRRQPDCPDCITLAPVRSAGGGDQPDTPCDLCDSTGELLVFPFDGKRAPCPACTDKENPHGR